MLFLCFLIIILKVVIARNCSLENEGECFYTVFCDDHATEVGPMVSCDNIDPFVTFIIENSTMAVITENFFTTNFNHRIRIFKATGNIWTNISSSAFSDLSNVLSIDLSDNSIAHLESAFVGLKYLDSLNISHNCIASINSETFLVSDYKTNLQLLDLSYNLLTYLLNDTFVNLSRLSMLFLEGNHISVLASGCFQPLKYLNVLNLSINKLNSLNMTLAPLKLLRELDISYNYFRTVPTLDFKELYLLEKVNLTYNKIQCLETDYKKHFTTTMSIDLSDIQICGASNAFRMSYAIFMNIIYYW